MMRNCQERSFVALRFYAWKLSRLISMLLPIHQIFTRPRVNKTTKKKRHPCNKRTFDEMATASQPNWIIFRRKAYANFYYIRVCTVHKYTCFWMAFTSMLSKVFVVVVGKCQWTEDCALWSMCECLRTSFNGNRA